MGFFNKNIAFYLFGSKKVSCKSGEEKKIEILILKRMQSLKLKYIKFISFQIVSKKLVSTLLNYFITNIKKISAHDLTWWIKISENKKNGFKEITESFFLNVFKLLIARFG